MSLFSKKSEPNTPAVPKKEKKNKLRLYVIHCTATPEGRNVLKEDIEMWHLGPADLPTGEVRYKGKVYKSRAVLPDEKINGISIKVLEGRGWIKAGYRKLILLNGRTDILIPYNNDEYVDSWEISNGVAGINFLSAHMVYAGGTDSKGVPKDTRTEQQKISMRNDVFEMIANHPDIMIAGHYHFDKGKACPSFNVEKWLEQIGVPEKNIYRPGKQI